MRTKCFTYNPWKAQKDKQPVRHISIPKNESELIINFFGFRAGYYLLCYDRIPTGLHLRITPTISWDLVQEQISNTYKQETQEDGPNIIAAATLKIDARDEPEFNQFSFAVLNFFHLVAANIWGKGPVNHRFKQTPANFVNFWKYYCVSKYGQTPRYSQIWQLVFNFLPLFWKNLPEFLSR